MSKQENQCSRRNFIVSAGMLAAGFYISPRQTYSRGIFGETNPVKFTKAEAAKSPITVQKLRNNISVLEGSGGNIIAFTGPEGKLMVDAGIDVSKDKIKKALAAISDKPVKYLVNTHWHFDHAGGNEWIHETGAAIIAQAKTRTHLAKTTRVEDWDYTFPASPGGALPNIVFDQEHTLRMNGETLKMHHYQPAHTDCDIYVHFENADVLHVGDTWWNGFYPFLDFNTGGNIDGMIEAADKNVNRVSDRTIIVPGHGPVGNKAQMIECRDMLGEVRNRIQVLKKRGQSLTEVVANKPTKAYDAKWGQSIISPAWFAKMVYRGV